MGGAEEHPPWFQRTGWGSKEPVGVATRPFKCPGKRACAGSLPASLCATRGGALKKRRASNPGLPEVGVAKRGSAALVGRGAARGRGLREEAWAAAAAPLPRAALSARREAAAVGGFAGLCSWDFGGGASGTRALVSSARSGGAARERAGAGGPPGPACEARG